MIFKCLERYCVLKYGYYKLENNIWGAPPEETDASQYIYYSDSDGRFGWEWNRPNPQKLDPNCTGSYCIMPIYPEAIIGNHPWTMDQPSTWSTFPKKVVDISTFKFYLGYNYTRVPIGSFNFAPEIWIVDIINFPYNYTKKVEIMFWINCTGGCNPGIYCGTFDDSYNTYKIYRADPSTDRPWLYYAFVLQQPYTGQQYCNIDIKKILDYVASKGQVDQNWYITDIEFGNEIWDGSGNIEINKLDIDMNGNVARLVQQQNIIKNPGFKNGINYWETYSTGMYQKYIYPESGRIGGSSVAIRCKKIESGKMAAWVQSLNINAINKYKLSGWIKTLDIIGGGASIRVDWKDANWRYLDTSNIMAHKTGTIPWTYFEGIVTPCPNAAKATVVLELYDCSGKVWFDDISFG